MSTEPDLTTSEAVLLRVIQEQTSLIAELRQLLRDSVDAREAAEARHSQERRSFPIQRSEPTAARAPQPVPFDRLTAPPSAGEAAPQQAEPPMRLPVDIAAAIEQARFTAPVQRQEAATELDELAIEAAKAAASGQPAS